MLLLDSIIDKLFQRFDNMIYKTIESERKANNASILERSRTELMKNDGKGLCLGVAYFQGRNRAMMGKSRCRRISFADLLKLVSNLISTLMYN